MQDKRPIHLNFLTIQFPITAIVSLLHRMSGIFIAVFVPVLLGFLKISLESKQQWDSIAVFFDSPWVIGTFAFIMAALIYHCLAGIRHLFMDIGIGDTKISGRKSAFYVLALTILVCIVWLLVFLG